jgi:hypothetical protein
MVLGLQRVASHTIRISLACASSPQTDAAFAAACTTQVVRKETQGQSFSGDVTGKTFTFANGGGLFVVTSDTETATGSGTQTATALAGVIDNRR